MNARRIYLLTASILVAAGLALGGCKAVTQTAAQQSATDSAASPPATMAQSAAPDAQEGASDIAEENTMKTITFEATDGLTVTGDLYLTGDDAAPFILLFHQADYSRGEYRQIAPKLNARGYNCLAVDQRSGRGVNDVVNETNKAAKAAGLQTNYADAYADLEGALQYVIAQYAPAKLIVWGSSYSSSLVLILAAEHPAGNSGRFVLSRRANTSIFRISASPTLPRKSCSRCSSPPPNRRKNPGAALRMRSSPTGACSSCRRGTGGTALPHCIRTDAEQRGVLDSGGRFSQFAEIENKYFVRI